MLRSMLVASASFFLLYYGFHTTLGNHALWMAFIVYLALRGIVQGGILYRMPHTNLHRQV
jgi:MATE family multidrug resistance protein